ncbi:MAG: R3H domain-containing nucleic acid-binding protein [Cyanobacteria bacterium J06597_1]
MSEDAQQATARGKEWLERVLTLMSVSSAVNVLDDYQLDIDSESLPAAEREVLLGNGGTTLDALQYLANTLLNLHQPEDAQHAFTVDLAGYRKQRNAELEGLIETAVEHVRSGQGEYEIPSLSAAERRQVHTLLSADGYHDLETFSRGKEPHRCLVVALAAATPE